MYKSAYLLAVAAIFGLFSASIAEAKRHPHRGHPHASMMHKKKMTRGAKKMHRLPPHMKHHSRAHHGAHTGR